MREYFKSGSDLLSRAVARQVPSTLLSLTSVFGMGTGGSSMPLPPDFSLSIAPSKLNNASRLLL
jgi:hypothetical protein